MVRVLHIVNRWKRGGVERFVEGLVEACGGGDVEQSILSVCTDVPSLADCPKYGPLHAGESMPSILLGAHALGGFLAGRGFDVVHVHTQNSSGFLYASVARKCGVPCRIVHSHNTSLGQGAGPVKKAAQAFFRALCGGSENVRLACSTEAGEHLFPGRDFRVVPNGVDVERFRFDPLARSEVRSALGVPEGALLVGCVGSMVAAKNHARALSVFAELRRNVPSARLLILGDGELRGALEREAVRLDISDSVFMPGFVDDAHRWYSAMDVLLFPSLYEGLPIALVEAQCNGLPIICSDAITREVGLLDTCRFISLNESNSVWVTALETARRVSASTALTAICTKGFNRETTIKLIFDIYEGCLNERNIPEKESINHKSRISSRSGRCWRGGRVSH